MVVRSLPAAVVALLVPLLCLAGDDPPPPDGNPGAAAAFPYFDDADGRRIARLELVAPSDAGASPLRLVVSATGAAVEPIAGYEGIAGANRFTAEQLGRILDGTRPISIRVRDRATGVDGSARIFAGRYGRVPQRRQRADGTIDYLALSPGGNLPLELHVEAGPLSFGRHDVELIVGGEPRLRLTLRRTAGGIRFEGVQSLGAHAAPGGHAPAVLPLLLAQQFDGPFQERAKPVLPPAPPPVDDAEWANRDAEGKWVLFARDIAKRPDAGLQWVRFLVDRKEYELLEWIALYKPGAYGSWMVGRSLAAANAPQWVRDAMWLRTGAFGHGDFEAQTLLAEQPGAVLSWLRRNPGVAPEMVEQFEKQEVQAVEAPDLLPALKPEDVFGPLDAPAQLEEFGDRSRAEAGKTYVHQVVRAIQGYVMSGPRGGPWEEKLRALTRHANPVVRRETYLAFTHKRFTPPPSWDLLKVIDDAAEPAGVREAATLAFSYGTHREVYAKLHHLAEDPRHPAWSAAVSRLGDIGDGFTEGHLDALQDLTPEQAKLARDSGDRIAARLSEEASTIARNDDGGRQTARHVLVERLRRAAWVDLGCDPLEATLVPWAIDTTRAEVRASPAMRREIEAIATPRSPAPAAKDAGEAEAAVGARVRLYVSRILGNAPGSEPASSDKPEASPASK
jgi:hypothetical protein